MVGCFFERLALRRVSDREQNEIFILEQFCDS